MADGEKTYLPVPSRKEHLDRVLAATEAVRQQSAPALENHDVACALIGTSLSVLFQAATCHRGCNHGPHIFEAVCGRAYNLGASAYLLAVSGFYDEAANLIRSIGEIGNLVSLSVADPSLFQQWLTSNPQKRKTDFTPMKVRLALERNQGIQIADQPWYSRFCETYTHITPETKPGMHNDAGKGNAGGVYQANGLALMLDELAGLLGSLGLLVSKFFKFEDLFSDLVSILDTAENAGR